MSLKFQFNKVALQMLQKGLKIRQNALPTLKSKEAYLRVILKKEKHLLDDLKKTLEKKLEEIQESNRLWAEFPDSLLQLQSVTLQEDNLAGIKVPVVREITYDLRPYSAFLSPAWLPWGIAMVKTLGKMSAEIEVSKKRIELLEYARKKTTQKVNLYEKVQIPEFSGSILKIKRYLEDVENLEKAGQKITKNRQNARVEVA